MSGKGSERGITVAGAGKGTGDGGWRRWAGLGFVDQGYYQGTKVLGLPNAPGIRPVSGHPCCSEQRRDGLIKEEVLLRMVQRERNTESA